MWVSVSLWREKKSNRVTSVAKCVAKCVAKWEECEGECEGEYEGECEGECEDFCGTCVRTCVRTCLVCDTPAALCEFIETPRNLAVFLDERERLTDGRERRGERHIVRGGSLYDGPQLDPHCR